MTRQSLTSHLLPALALLFAAAGPAAAGGATRVTGHVRQVTGGVVPAAPNTRLTVAAVDEAGRIVERQETADRFALTLPSGHTYTLLFVATEDDGAVGTFVWGEGETAFRAEGETIDLGWVAVNPESRRAVALRELDLRPPRTDRVVVLEDSP
ncbi:MAG: hypothetical protein D6739_09330 [Nitrospirae bacterium]|nr:MAG: hypothetical protein D6739_09330 [Nitrospirota bacterium]